MAGMGLTVTIPCRPSPKPIHASWVPPYRCSGGDPGWQRYTHGNCPVKYGPLDMDQMAGYLGTAIEIPVPRRRHGEHRAFNPGSASSSNLDGSAKS